MIEIGKIKEGMTGRQVADLLYDNFLAVISGLGEYATEKWVTDKGYITKASLNGYATEQWVTGRGYITAAAVAEGYATIASVNELAGGVSASLAAVNAALAERVEKTKFAEYFSTEMAKWFVKDDTNRGIKPVNSYGLYSDAYVSAKGVSTGTGGSGGGSSYNRLDRWSDYSSDKAGWVLSALLGQDLNSRVASLESGSALSVTTSGSGNAVTGVSKSGNQLVITKGATFLTKHQSLAGYATTTALNNGLAGKQDKITNSNKLAYSLISGTPTSLPASDVAAWAKAASKPSYAFSEITNKPTTLSGYGITDAYTSSVIDGKLSGYLPLSGGTINGDLILDSTTNSRWLQFQTGSGAGYIGYRSDVDNWYLTNKNWFNEYIIIHSGNIGSQSVAYATSAGSATKLQTPRNIWGQSFDGTGNVSGVLSDVNQISFDVNKSYGIFRGDWITSTMSRDDIGIYSPKIYLGGNVFIRTTTGIGHSTARLQIYNSENEWSSIHYTDNSAVSIAHQLGYGMLITSKSNNRGKYLLSIRYNDSDLMGFGSSALSVFDNGNVGIGTTSPTEKLHVAGNIVATGGVTAKSSSDYRLKCEFDYSVDYQERLLSLGKVCDFNYTPHAQEREFAFADDKRHTSVIWQDARKANITGFCSVEEDGYGTINPLSADLIFTMVGAIQQGIVKTERIEERVVRLEKENRELKEKINLLEGGRYGC